MAAIVGVSLLAEEMLAELMEVVVVTRDGRGRRKVLANQKLSPKLRTHDESCDYTTDGLIAQVWSCR